MVDFRSQEITRGRLRTPRDDLASACGVCVPRSEASPAAALRPSAAMAASDLWRRQDTGGKEGLVVDCPGQTPFIRGIAAHRRRYIQARRMCGDVIVLKRPTTSSWPTGRSAGDEECAATQPASRGRRARLRLCFDTRSSKKWWCDVRITNRRDYSSCRTIP